MTGMRAPDPLTGAVALLERAVGFTRTSVAIVTADRMTASTPCHRWDLRALLEHLDESLLALQEGAEDGFVGLEAGGPDGSDAGAGPGDLVTRVRLHTGALLGAWVGVVRDGGSQVGPVWIAGRPVDAGLMVGVGALEIAVHGWDVARACGVHRAVPPGLAGDLLALAPGIVGPEDRPDRFADAVPPGAGASPGDRLLAALGRSS